MPLIWSCVMAMAEKRMLIEVLVLEVGNYRFMPVVAIPSIR